MSERSLADPPLTPESEPFFTAAKEGRFLLRRCLACGKAHWYPRALCLSASARLFGKRRRAGGRSTATA